MVKSLITKYLVHAFEANWRQANQILADIMCFFFCKMWMSVAQVHIPATTMNPALIAQGPTSVTASLVFSGIQIRCIVKVIMVIELNGVQ